MAESSLAPNVARPGVFDRQVGRRQADDQLHRARARLGAGRRDDVQRDVECLGERRQVQVPRLRRVGRSALRLQRRVGVDGVDLARERKESAAEVGRGCGRGQAAQLRARRRGRDLVAGRDEDLDPRGRVVVRADDHTDARGGAADVRARHQPRAVRGEGRAGEDQRGQGGGCSDCRTDGRSHGRASRVAGPPVTGLVSVRSVSDAAPTAIEPWSANARYARSAGPESGPNRIVSLVPFGRYCT